MTHPGFEQIGRRPSRFLARETAQRQTARIVDEVHQATFPPARFEPLVVRTVDLDQLAQVRFTPPPRAMRLALAALHQLLDDLDHLRPGCGPGGTVR